MSLDPRLRTRAAAPAIRPTEKRERTNEELAAEFDAALFGRVSEDTRESYRTLLRDARAYFTREDGTEIPFAEWTKEGVFGYVQHVENNYCGSFRTLSFLKPPRVMCDQGVWQGHRAPEDGLSTCSTCPLFKRPIVNIRINALTRLFDYLSGHSYVAFNFMRDVRKMHAQTIPRHEMSNKGEKKRNPTRAEAVQLVNGTSHPMRRFLYAASLKWWPRPHELFLLDRFGSFGLTPPAGVPEPRGCERGYAHHPELRPFDQGGRMVYLPDVKGALDKRQGNRWLVTDDELRPIVEAALAYWEAKVKRDARGRPAHTRLLINSRGEPLEIRTFNRWLAEDCERLGLMQPGDRKKPLRKWTGGCGRHFGGRLMQEVDVAPDWQNHFRGDKFHDARGEYYAPTPLETQAKYLKWIPTLGFLPVPPAIETTSGSGDGGVVA